MGFEIFFVSTNIIHVCFIYRGNRQIDIDKQIYKYKKKNGDDYLRNKISIFKCFVPKNRRHQLFLVFHVK